MQTKAQTKEEFLDGFKECFGCVEDIRQMSKIDYPLMEILFLTIVAIAGGAYSWGMIEAFGKAHLTTLRDYYPFKNGSPSDDTIRRVFELIDPKNLNDVLIKYFIKDTDTPNKHIAIDGKTLRGSGSNGKKALHFLNVYAVDSGITLFGKRVDEKTNEITAIPEAIDLLDLKGATVTIDAMGCQKSIAQKIIDKGADYIFGLKGNHAILHNQVKMVFETNTEIFFSMEISKQEETGHGRIEERMCRVVRDLTKIPNALDWPGMASAIEVKRKTMIKGVTSETANYYISSSNQDAQGMLQSIRSHWGIESMHWILDVVFREDASSMQKGNIPVNMAIVRRFVLNILDRMKGKRETRPELMRMVGWSPEYLRRFINLLTICS